MLGTSFSGLAKPSQQFEAEAAWPTKALRVIVGYTAGSSPDVQARLLSSQLSVLLCQPVIVENKPGAGGSIGAGLVAKAVDGHTIGMVGNGPLTTSPLLYPKLPYTVATDFVPIGLLCSSPLIWVDSGKRPMTTLDQLLVALQSEGGERAYGSVGFGSGGHLGMELIKERYRLRLLHVPFTGGPAIVNAILGGQIDMALLPMSTTLPLIRAGRLRALAVCASKRVQLVPSVPALSEISTEGEPIEIEVWNGVVAPANIQPHALARLMTAFTAALDQPELKQAIEQQGWSIRDTSASALTRRITEDAYLYRSLISRTGLRIE